MLNCFSTFDNSSPDPITFFFGLILIFLIVSFKIDKWWKNKNAKQEEVLDSSSPIYFKKDILGQEMPVYNDKSESYKPFKGLSLRISLFVLLAIFACGFLIEAPEKYEPMGDFNGWGSWISIDQGIHTAQKYIKLYDDPMFPSEYTLIPLAPDLSQRDYFAERQYEKPKTALQKSFSNQQEADYRDLSVRPWWY